MDNVVPRGAGLPTLHAIILYPVTRDFVDPDLGSHPVFRQRSTPQIRNSI
jgi:hypothetical protein